MLTKLGQKFTDGFTKYMPSAYVFALLLTLLTGKLESQLTSGEGFLPICSTWSEVLTNNVCGDMGSYKQL